MEKVFHAETVATVDELFSVVADLSTYPDWIELVHRVEPLAAGDADVVDDEPEWWVTLRAQIGPLARSKRLRMARTINNPPDHDGDRSGHVRFERSETDGRDHAAWTMEVTVVALDGDGPGGDRSRADCRLHYGGSMWTGLLDAPLELAAGRAAASLQRIAAARTSQ